MGLAPGASPRLRSPAPQLAVREIQIPSLVKQLPSFDPMTQSTAWGPHGAEPPVTARGDFRAGAPCHVVVPQNLEMVAE